MTIRLTDAQMTVLRALDEWDMYRVADVPSNWQDVRSLVEKKLIERKLHGSYSLTSAGRALIATLKAEVRW